MQVHGAGHGAFSLHCCKYSVKTFIYMVYITPPPPSPPLPHLTLHNTFYMAQNKGLSAAALFDPWSLTLSTDNLPCHFVSAFGAGFVTTVIASPVDVVKTRYMNSPKGQYRSAINCAWTMMTKEGPTAFYKG